MFSSKIANSPAKAPESPTNNVTSQRSTFVRHRLGHEPGRQAWNEPREHGVQAAQEVAHPREQRIPARASERASRGEPLERGLRARFERQLERDLSDVRIHTGSDAVEVAQGLRSRAYTVGHDIHFNAGRYRPQTAEGLSLLAHELAHVAQHSPSATPRYPLRVSQPGEPAEIEADRMAADLLAGHPTRTGQSSCEPAIYRAPDSRTGQTSPAVMKPEERIQQWLDTHQFAPPESQPDEGEEKHVLLNGEEMKLSEAVKLAATGTSQPAGMVKSVIESMLDKPVAGTLAGLPVIGPGNQRRGGGIRLGDRDAFGVNPAISKTVEYSTIDDYLQKHDFATPEVRDPSATKVLFDGKEQTVDWVVDRVMTLLGQYPTLKRSEVMTYIRQKYVAKRGGPGNQIVFGYTLIPKALQRVGGPPDPLNPLRTQHQFSFTITRQHHAGDSPGFETSFQGSVTLNDQGIANVQAGGQEAVVIPLLKGWFQLSGLVQAMASANWNKTATGSTVIAPAVQATGGGQALVTPVIRSGDWKFLTGHVQFGVQAVAGAQKSFAPSPAGVVGVANVGFVLNIPF